MRYNIIFCNGTRSQEHNVASAIHAVAYAYRSDLESIHDTSPENFSMDLLDVVTAGDSTECRLCPGGEIVARIVGVA